MLDAKVGLASYETCLGSICVDGSKDIPNRRIYKVDNRPNKHGASRCLGKRIVVAARVAKIFRRLIFLIWMD
jgi:hypothetical protein